MRISKKTVLFSLLLLAASAISQASPHGAGNVGDDLPEVPRAGGLSQLDGAIRKAAADRKARDERIAYEQARWFELERDSRHGNRLELLTTGKDSYRVRKELIQSAKRSIYLSAYGMKADPVMKEILELMCAKRAEGVDVRIIGDNIGAGDLRKFEKIYKGCKLPVMYYNEVTRWGLNHALYSMHEKLFIIDGERLVMGGAGWDKGYADFGKNIDDWWDLDIRVDGPAACQLHREFVQNWKDSVNMYLPLRFRKKWREEHRHMIGEDKMANCAEKDGGNSNALPIYSNPLFHGGAHPILDAYLKAIAASSSEITLYAPYFMPREDFMAALIGAHRRGVRVRILTNSRESNDEEFSLVAAFALSRKLIEEGVEIYLWPHKSTMHRKAGIFDRRWSYVGSDNLNGRGQKWNSETVIFSDDEAIAAQLSSLMEADFKGLEKLTVELMEKNFDELPWKARKLFPLLRPFMQGPAN